MSSKKVEPRKVYMTNPKFDIVYSHYKYREKAEVVQWIGHQTSTLFVRLRFSPDFNKIPLETSLLMQISASSSDIPYKDKSFVVIESNFFK